MDTLIRIVYQVLPRDCRKEKVQRRVVETAYLCYSTSVVTSPGRSKEKRRTMGKKKIPDPVLIKKYEIFTSRGHLRNDVFMLTADGDTLFFISDESGIVHESDPYSEHGAVYESIPSWLKEKD